MKFLQIHHREYVHSIVVDQTSWPDNYHFSQMTNIFDIRPHYVHILFIFQRLNGCVLLFSTPTNMNSTVYGNRLAFLITS